MLKKIMVAALALTFVLGFATFAAAADVKVGGSLRTELTWAFYDDESSPTGDSNFELKNFHISSSRLNFTYLSDDKKFKAFTELRLRSRSQGLNVDIRHAYFTYSWDGGSILFGQTSPIASPYFSNQILETANANIGYGKAYFARTEQIRLTMGEKYKLQFAIESPQVTSDYVDQDGNDTGYGYAYFPAFAAGLDMSFGNVNIYPWIRWEWNRIYTDQADDVNWHSLDFGLSMTGDFGLVGFSLEAAYGINSAQTNPNGSGQPAPIFNATWDEQSDHKQLAFWGELRIGGLSLGGGYQVASRDDLDGVEVWANDPYTASAYVNYKIPFGKITFMPEVYWENYGEDETGADKGNAFKFGLFAIMNF